MDFDLYVYNDFNLKDVLNRIELKNDFKDMLILGDYYKHLEFCNEFYSVNPKEKSKFWYDKAYEIAYKQHNVFAIDYMISKWKQSTDEIGLIMAKSCFLELKHIADSDVKNEEIANACWLLSDRYVDGEIVMPDETQELNYLLKSANMGNTDAMVSLYRFYSNQWHEIEHEQWYNTQKAFEWLRKAAITNVEAMYILVCSNEVEDEQEKIALIKKAAEKKYIFAIITLAEYYNALNYKKKALDQYSIIYNCSTVSLSLRISIIKKAIEICKNHRVVFKSCNDGRYDYKSLEEKLFKFYQNEINTNRNKMEYMYQLALCYEKGIGTLKNKEKAIECYREAAFLGNKKAKNFLLDIEKENYYHKVKKLPAFIQRFLFVMCILYGI